MGSSTPVKRPEVKASYYTVDDVMTILGCKRTKAQDVIRELNDELADKGFKRRKQGTVSQKYFNERFYI